MTIMRPANDNERRIVQNPYSRIAAYVLLWLSVLVISFMIPV